MLAGPGPGPAGAPGRPGFAGTLPAHCRVEGVLERRTGVNGVEYVDAELAQVLGEPSTLGARSSVVESLIRNG